MEADDFMSELEWILPKQAKECALIRKDGAVQLHQGLDVSYNIHVLQSKHDC